MNSGHCHKKSISLTFQGLLCFIPTLLKQPCFSLYGADQSHGHAILMAIPKGNSSYLGDSLREPLLYHVIPGHS